MIRLLIAEDQHLVRGALAALLDLEPDFEVVAQAADGTEAVELALRERPDVALLDIEMPGLDGISVAERLHTDTPETLSMIVTTFGRPGYLRRAMDAGARGFVLKDTHPDLLAGLIRQMVGGALVVDGELAVASLESGPNPLTSRERAVLRQAEGGGSATSIAAALRISEGTIRNYLSRAIGKIGASNRNEAARAARDKGWL